MDSLSFSGIFSSHHVSPSTMLDFDQSNHRRDGVFLGKKSSFARKQDRQGLTITHVASPLPVIVPSLKKEILPDLNHVAWTSVRQERWEGELVVQGEIPLWLVRKKTTILASS